MHLSVLIPAKNEAANIADTVHRLYQTLAKHQISHEILVVNDHSADQTEAVLNNLSATIPSLVCKNNTNPSGFGNAIRYGLSVFKGDAVAIVMADGAENSHDVVRCWQLLEETGNDCVFGSRFIKGGQTFHYPFLSWLLNRLANHLMSWVFRKRYNDFTNSFKLYRRSIVQQIQPLTAEGFGITIELSLKALAQTDKVSIPPIQWHSRKGGKSKFSLIKNMPEYLNVLLKVGIFRN